MSEIAATQTILPKDGARVRVGRVDEPIGWWFATVKSVDDKQVNVRMHCKEEDSVVRSYPLNQVKLVDEKDCNWMIGLRVELHSKKLKRRAHGMVVDVKNMPSIQFASSVRENRAFMSVVDALDAKAEECSLEVMPWNLIEPYQGPDIAVGTEIYKQFDAGWFFGNVDEGPLHQIFVEDDQCVGRGYYFHVSYSDGDEEWLSPEDIQSLAKEAKKQRRKETTKKIAGKGTKLPMRTSNKQPNRRQAKQVEHEAESQTEGDEEVNKTTKKSSKKRAASKENELPAESNKMYTKPAIKRSKKTVAADNYDNYDEFSSEGDAVDHAVAASRQRRPRASKKPVEEQTACTAAASSKGQRTDSDSNDDQQLDEILAVREVESKALAPMRDENPIWGHFELNSSLCSEFDRLLFSKDCMSGACGYQRMLAFHKRYPNKESRRKMIDLLVCGPIGHNRNTRFPDKSRTLAGVDTINMLLEVGGMHTIFAADLDDSGWEDCLAQMTRPIFACEGDEQRTNRDAVLRIGDSLYVKAHCMEFFVELLEHEQKRCTPSCDAVFKKTLLPSIAMKGHAGSRAALELAVKAYAHLLINHGHFLTGPRKSLSMIPEGPTYDCLKEATCAAERLYQALGKAVSIFAWLYAIMESEKVLGVSHLIGSMFLNELQSSRFDPAPFVDEAAPHEQYWEEIKLQFIIGLPSEFVSQLRPLLADKLSVAALYNCIFA